MTDAERAQYVPVGKQFTITTGYEGSDASGELLIGPGSTHQLTSTSTVKAYEVARFNVNNNRNTLQSSIRPLAAGNDEFTLAIDYAFDSDYINNSFTGTEAVLMACYEKNSSNTAGFRLYYRKNEGPKVSFGDTMIDNQKSAKYRNMLVLRHPANSTVLYIYSGVNTSLMAGNSSSILDDIYDNNFIQTIEWSNVNTNAPLVFGNIALSEDEQS